MLQYLFFDSILSTRPKKKMETEKWRKAADSPLYLNGSLLYPIRFEMKYFVTKQILNFSSTSSPLKIQNFLDLFLERSPLYPTIRDIELQSAS